VALVADVDDAVPLAGTHLHLVVDLCDERTHGVDDVAATCPGGLEDFGCRAVGRKHDRAPGLDLVDVVDEHDAELAEAVDDELVVDDLVVAVDGRFERADYPGQCLDGHLDAGAESAWLCEEHTVDGHRGVQGTARATAIAFDGRG
jgi:hypothetical protein